MTRYLCAIAVIAMLSSSVEAEIVQFKFEGKIEEVNDSPPFPWSSAAVGDDFDLTYVFDSTTPDMDILNDRHGLYVDTMLHGSLSIDGASSSILTGNIEIDYMSSWHEYFGFIYTTDDFAIVLDLYDNEEILLSSDALPLDLDFAQLDGVIDRKSITVIHDGQVVLIGEIHSFESTIIPAPAALSVFLLGMAWRGGRRRC